MVDLKNLTLEEKQKLADAMFKPLRCGGAGYDENGKYYLIIGGVRRYTKEINQIIREMNPAWSEEALKPHLYDEDK